MIDLCPECKKHGVGTRYEDGNIRLLRCHACNHYWLVNKINPRREEDYDPGALGTSAHDSETPND